MSELEQLENMVRMNEVLRPDRILANVVGYDRCIEYPIESLNETPPTPLEHNSELLTIDEYLGDYRPAARTIRIFMENVVQAAQILDCNKDALVYVIRYHEQAHAGIHLGTTRADLHKALKSNDHMASRLNELTASFKSIDPVLHEHLAQLLTYHSIQSLSTIHDPPSVKNAAALMMDAFTKLLKRQPPQYRVEPYFDRSLARVRGTISLIKRGMLMGQIDPWKEVMSWD